MNQNRHYFVVLAPSIGVSILLGMLSTAACRAADPYQLPQLHIADDWLGTPTEARVRQYPGARDIVTEDSIHRSGARTVEDALRLVPGVRTQDESGVGILPNIGVRGLHPLRSEQALILVDGIPVTLAPYGQTGMSLFPLTMQNVERIDVVRGGAAVHYGPNNIGGVINFITKPIPSQFGAEVKETLTLSGSDQVLTDTYARIGGYVSDALGWQLHANVIDGESFREHSDTQINNFMFDIDWLIGDGTQLKARLQYYDTDSELPGALSPEDYARDREQSTRPHDFFLADTLRGSISLTKLFENDNELTWTTFAHDSTREFGFGFPLDTATATAVMTSPREFWVYGTEPRFTFNLPSSIPQKIMLGARYVREEVDFIVDRTELDTGVTSVPRDWRFENDAYALYISDTFSLLGERLKITPGVRYESLDSYFRNNEDSSIESNKTTDTLPGLDIGYQFDEQFFIFANYHQSLRPVQFVHVVRGGDLSSERADNYELGLRYTPVERMMLSATLFRLDFEDKIEFDAEAGQFRNLGKARHQGVESALQWAPSAMPELQLLASYTYLDTEQLAGDDQGKALPFASRHQFTTEMRYSTGQWKWNLNGSYYSAAYTDSANTREENATGSIGEIPAYWLWNARVTREFNWGGTALEAGLGINNLLDEDYYFRGVDYSFGRMPAPGRSILLSLAARI